jgi:hypothetical protein
MMIGNRWRSPKTLLPPGAKEGDVVENDLGDFATVAEVSDITAVFDYHPSARGKPKITHVRLHGFIHEVM